MQANLGFSVDYESSGQKVQHDCIAAKLDFNWDGVLNNTKSIYLIVVGYWYIQSLSWCIFNQETHNHLQPFDVVSSACLPYMPSPIKSATSVIMSAITNWKVAKP